MLSLTVSPRGDQPLADQIVAGIKRQIEDRHPKLWKTRERKPEAEVVEMAVPPIIDAAEFEAVQTLLTARAAHHTTSSQDIRQAGRRRMRTESGGYRRDHLRALAQRVEVDRKEVRIMGSKSELLRTLVAASSAKTAGFGVPSFVPKWRALRESNPCFRRERAASWTARRRARGAGNPARRHIKGFARCSKEALGQRGAARAQRDQLTTSRCSPSTPTAPSAAAA